MNIRDIYVNIINKGYEGLEFKQSGVRFGDLGSESIRTGEGSHSWVLGVRISESEVL